MTKIPRSTARWLYVVLAVKVISIAISAYTLVWGSWGWVPSSSSSTLVVALAFVLSSLVLLHVLPRLGLVSTAAYGALTFYGAATSLVMGQYFVWSSIAGLTGLVLVGLVIRGWRQLPANQSSIES